MYIRFHPKKSFNSLLNKIFSNTHFCTRVLAVINIHKYDKYDEKFVYKKSVMRTN